MTTVKQQAKFLSDLAETYRCQGNMSMQRRLLECEQTLLEMWASMVDETIEALTDTEIITVGNCNRRQQLYGREPFGDHINVNKKAS